MTRIKGKEQLCSCEKKYFKSFQGFGDRILIDRYPDIERQSPTMKEIPSPGIPNPTKRRLEDFPN